MRQLEELATQNAGCLSLGDDNNHNKAYNSYTPVSYSIPNAADSAVLFSHWRPWIPPVLFFSDQRNEPQPRR